MVGTIDIHRLTDEELAGVVSLYPWFGAAQALLCTRMAAMGALSSSQVSQAALHVQQRSVLRRASGRGASDDCSDADARSIVDAMLSTGRQARPRVHVVGGDYFSQEDYSRVRDARDGIFSSFAVVRGDSEPMQEAVESEPQENDFCTETLARIYLEQDYREQAMEIYSKLSLRYPEKSVYFAALIDEIKQKDNK